VIVDASVIVGWFLPDEHGAERDELRTAILASSDGVMVPGICWMEVAHALVRALRRGRLPPDAAGPAAATLEELMTLIPTREVDPAAALRLALDIGSGAFDAAYLVLARGNDKPLVTHDRRLAELATVAGVALRETAEP